LHVYCGREKKISAKSQLFSQYHGMIFVWVFFGGVRGGGDSMKNVKAPEGKLNKFIAMKSGNWRSIFIKSHCYLRATAVHLKNLHNNKFIELAAALKCLFVAQCFRDKEIKKSVFSCSLLIAFNGPPRKSTRNKH
jgi:hypothetical protein